MRKQERGTTSRCGKREDAKGELPWAFWYPRATSNLVQFLKGHWPRKFPISSRPLVLDGRQLSVQMEPVCCRVVGKLASSWNLSLLSSPPPVCWVPLEPHSSRTASHRQAGCWVRKQGPFSPHPPSSGKAFGQFSLWVTQIVLPHQLQICSLLSRASRCFSVNWLTSNQTLLKAWFKGVEWVMCGDVRLSQRGFSRDCEERSSCKERLSLALLPQINTSVNPIELSAHICSLSGRTQEGNWGILGLGGRGRPLAKKKKKSPHRGQRFPCRVIS